MKRSFSSSRLYKLLKVTVIVVSILSVLLVAISYEQLFSESRRNRWSEMCNAYTDVYTRGDCWRLEAKESEGLRNTLSKSLKIMVLLPLFFFGGIALYKYLFPAKDKEI